jgi:serine/threonine-protein kinase
LAEAVQVAHQSGIVHRDLKPANILLTADGTPKIADFGLARRLEGGAGLTQSGAAVGTPSYMAPEQARTELRALGPAVDVYALGVILYELLTGRPPFQAETEAETVQQVIHQDPAPPSQLNAKVPRDLETICLKCLQKDSRKRYTTAAELASDLGRILNYEPIRARPTGRVAHFLRWVRRRPALAVGLAGSMLLVVGLAGGGLWLERQRAQRQDMARAVVEEALEQIPGLRRQGRWAEARAVLTQANSRLRIAAVHSPPFCSCIFPMAGFASAGRHRLSRLIRCGLGT